MLQRLPIRIRLLLLIAVPLALVELGASWMHYRNLVREGERMLVHEAQALAQGLTDEARLVLLDYGWESPEILRESAAAIPGLRYLELFDESGLGVYSHRREDLPERVLALMGDELLFTGDELVVRVPVVHEGSVLGTLQMTRGAEGSGRREEALQSLRTLTLMLLGALVAACLLQQRITRPITRLTTFLEEVTRDGSYERRLELADGAELGSMRDGIHALLSDIVRREEELHEALQAAERASEAKGRFLANMSHEIRTPMTAVLGMANEIREDPSDEAAVAEAAGLILDNGRHLLQILNDVLDLSKIEAVELEVERVPYSPIDVVRRTVTAMWILAEGKGLPLHSEFVPPLPEQVTGDPTRLRQVLINLIGNAIKFTSAGELRVRVSWGEDPEPVLEVDVIDTGIGMTEEQVSRVFGAFVQADSSITRRYGGTGLGLHLARALAQAMGGDLEVRSAPGEGSTFRLRVAAPLVPGATRLWEPQHIAAHRREEEPEAHGQERPLDGMRVLVAEDVPTNRLVLTRLLTKLGAEVVAAQDGREALEAALEARDGGVPFDVVLMDLQMPVLDGMTATVELRRRGYQGRVLALTASAHSGDRAACIANGFDGFASKPVRRAALLAAIHGRPLAHP